MQPTGRLLRTAFCWMPWLLYAWRLQMPGYGPMLRANEEHLCAHLAMDYLHPTALSHTHCLDGGQQMESQAAVLAFLECARLCRPMRKFHCTERTVD